MNFIENPNLPAKKVKYVVVDSRAEALFASEFNKLGVKRITVNCDSRLQIPVSGHADIHLFHSGKGDFFTSDSFCKDFEIAINSLKPDLKDCEIFNNRRVKEKLNAEYPGDVLLNAVSIGKYLICNSDTVSSEILGVNTRTVINVKQGYTKCSVCPVTENAIITDDVSVYKAVNKFIDVLLVDHSGVVLSGYNYGFIGGCCGKLSADTLCFTGDLLKSDFSNEIISFCKNHNVECISLNNGPLYDFGSIIPIIE